MATKHPLQATAPDTSSHQGSLRSYLAGYVLSLALTLEAYFLVVKHSYTPATLVAVILILAIVQLLIQLFYFLHLDRAFKAPWNIIIFGFMAFTVSLVVFGSLWIMKNLNYNMTVYKPDGTTTQVKQTPQELDQYIPHDESIQTNSH